MAEGVGNRQLKELVEWALSKRLDSRGMVRYRGSPGARIALIVLLQTPFAGSDVPSGI